jgi:hypothetical protein
MSRCFRGSFGGGFRDGCYLRCRDCLGESFVIVVFVVVSEVVFEVECAFDIDFDSEVEVDLDDDVVS